MATGGAPRPRRGAARPRPAVARAQHALHGDPLGGQPVADLGVDPRQAGRLALVAAPADGDRARAPARLRGPLAGVVALQLVHVLAEPRAAARCRPAAARAGPARRPAGRARRPAPARRGRRPAGRRRRRCTNSAIPPIRAASTGTRPARHSATTSGAQSHHSDGITATSTPPAAPAARSCENAPQTRPRRARRARAGARRTARAPRRGSARATSARRLRCAASTSSSGPCADRPSRRSRPSAARRPGPARGRAPAAPRSACPAGIAWRTTSIISAG